MKMILRDESVITGDGEGESHELPVCLLLLLVGDVGDLETGRVVRPSRHAGHVHRGAGQILIVFKYGQLLGVPECDIPHHIAEM